MSGIGRFFVIGAVAGFVAVLLGAMAATLLGKMLIGAVAGAAVGLLMAWLLNGRDRQTGA